MNATADSVGVFIDPPTHHFLNDRLFGSEVARFGGYDLLAPHAAVRDALGAAGVPVHTADLIDAVPVRRKLFVSLGGRERFRTLAGRDDVRLSAFFAMECPIVEPSLYAALPAVARAFPRVFSWSDAESLLPFTGRPVPVQPFRWPQSLDGVREDLWERDDRGFLVMINANKLPRLYDRELYTARLRAVEHFHRFGEIDLYGPNWDRMPNRVGRTWIPATARRAYRVVWEWRQRRWPDPLYAAAAEASRGPTPDKLRTLSQYRFALCFENMTLNGWITEKLFDCFFAGTVPVYWGAPDVERWIPAEAFIDMRRFAGFPELRAFLHRLTDGEAAAYRRAARAFLASERFAPFRKRAFVDLFRRILREDAGLAAWSGRDRAGHRSSPSPVGPARPIPRQPQPQEGAPP